MTKLAKPMTGQQAQRLAWELTCADDTAALARMALTKGLVVRDLNWTAWHVATLYDWIAQEGAAGRFEEHLLVEFKQPHAERNPYTGELLQVSPGDWFAMRDDPPGIARYEREEAERVAYEESRAEEAELREDPIHGDRGSDDGTGPCDTCAEGLPQGECPKSKRACGHHSNESWDQDKCFWCGEEWGF